MTRTRAIVGLAAILIVCFGAGFAGSQFTRPALEEWYAGLEKPPFTPPDEVFMPVWTTLYFLMGVSAWLVWLRKRSAPAAVPLAVFAIQLLLNIGWSWIFFGLRMPGVAFIELIFLESAIIATIAGFWSIRPIAGMLLIPYLLWCLFASVLNLFIWLLNFAP
ncbi:MAG: tryptophan-rich sensory protein [Planctomycetes bacterium]|nr:tryptophan-rich sensory protein [Planctomycetota bacterium]